MLSLRNIQIADFASGFSANDVGSPSMFVALFVVVRKCVVGQKYKVALVPVVVTTSFEQGALQYAFVAIHRNVPSR